VPEAAFRLLSGTPKTYVKKADTGATSHQLFCPECASPLYSISLGAGPRTFNLRLGTARQRAKLSPKVQYWCRSAQDWAAVKGPSTRIETQ
jgi:hypothetical protein